MQSQKCIVHGGKSHPTHIELLTLNLKGQFLIMMTIFKLNYVLWISGLFGKPGKISVGFRNAVLISSVVHFQDQEQYWWDKSKPYVSVSPKQFSEMFRTSKMGQEELQALDTPHDPQTQAFDVSYSKFLPMPTHKWVISLSNFDRTMFVCPLHIPWKYFTLPYDFLCWKVFQNLDFAWTQLIADVDSINAASS